jgi:hypothetical protein
MITALANRQSRSSRSECVNPFEHHCSNGEKTVRNGILTILVAAGFLLALGLQLTAGAQGDVISIDLKTFKFKAKEGVRALNQYSDMNWMLCFYTNGYAEAPVRIPEDGAYEITVKASCDAAMKENAKFNFWVENVLIDKETLLTSEEYRDYKFLVTVKAGDRKVAVEFTNDVYKADEYDRNLFVHDVKVKKVK